MQSETCGHWENKGGKLHRTHTLSDTPMYHTYTIGINNYMVRKCLPEQGT